MPRGFENERCEIRRCSRGSSHDCRLCCWSVREKTDSRIRLHGRLLLCGHSVVREDAGMVGFYGPACVSAFRRRLGQETVIVGRLYDSLVLSRRMFHEHERSETGVPGDRL